MLPAIIEERKGNTLLKQYKLYSENKFQFDSEKIQLHFTVLQPQPTTGVCDQICNINTRTC